ncbi:GNAT family N-acetyltransferase [Martelella mediterranea]|uniref:Putative acetyltransferase n=1 Tax=Martelella mediterranea TaxID=293089 RepID=A0A4R3NSP3_9HYPH|nr:N-acetyltransferase [Martelella mediterranea]TCT39333.1 putative acetyltransferase [Martelella mediterranea]
MRIRRETPADIAAVDRLIGRAFDGHPHSDGSEPAIVRRLRKAEALELALVAEEDGEILGHIAFSPVGFEDGSDGWFGLGPLSVEPSHQRQGIGSSLMLGGLELMRDDNAAGVVLVGDPKFYTRFGFQSDTDLSMEGVPPENLLALPFDGDIPKGQVAFHRAFFGDL